MRHIRWCLDWSVRASQEPYVASGAEVAGQGAGGRGQTCLFSLTVTLRANLTKRRSRLDTLRDGVVDFEDQIGAPAHHMVHWGARDGPAAACRRLRGVRCETAPPHSRGLVRAPRSPLVGTETIGYR